MNLQRKSLELGFSGSKGICSCNFQRYWQIPHHRGQIFLHSPQKCMSTWIFIAYVYIIFLKHSFYIKTLDFQLLLKILRSDITGPVFLHDHNKLGLNVYWGQVNTVVLVSLGSFKSWLSPAPSGWRWAPHIPGENWAQECSSLTSESTALCGLQSKDKTGEQQGEWVGKCIKALTIQH